MKKYAIFLLAALMALLPACTAAPTAAPGGADAPEATTAPAGKPVIAVSLPALDNPLMLGMSDAFTNTFSADYDVQVVSADNNPNSQATQVQNFTAMKPKLLYINASEPTSLVPNLIAAREAGVIVMMAGGNPGDPEAYDSLQQMNQFMAGWYSAYLAKQWIDQTYPDAADGSIDAAILESTGNTEALERTNGLKMIAQPFMRNAKGDLIDAQGKLITVVPPMDKVANPAYSSKVKIVVNVEAQMFQAGQTAMQNILTTNPNVKLVLAYAGDGGMGASQAILDEYAKGPGVSVIDDLSKVAVFGVGMIGAEGPAVLDSATNKSVFRGTIRFGGDLIGRTIEYANKILNGDIQKIIYDPLDIVTVIDGKLMGLPIQDTEVFQVPTGTPEEIKLGPPPGP